MYKKKKAAPKGRLLKSLGLCKHRAPPFLVARGPLFEEKWFAVLDKFVVDVFIERRKQFFGGLVKVWPLENAHVRDPDVVRGICDRQREYEFKRPLELVLFHELPVGRIYDHFEIERPDVAFQGGRFEYIEALHFHTSRCSAKLPHVSCEKCH